MKHSQGFTLVEVLITLSVMSILLGIAAPQINASYQYYRADKAIRTIQQTLLYARNYAISFGKNVTICPNKNNNCTNDWLQGITVFTDENKSNSIDDNDIIIQEITHFSEQDAINFNREYIRFQANGSAAGSNGTLIYCPGQIDSPYSKAIVINRSGRVRFSQDKMINCL